MADNYLERRMEDMRNGKLAASVKINRATPRAVTAKSGISRRVLIADLPEKITDKLGSLLVSKGHKVACFHTLPSISCNSTYRNYKIESEEDLRNSFRDLCSVRLDLDIIICGKSLLRQLTDLWLEHRERLPLPNPFGGRLINIVERKSEENFRSERSGFMMTQIICPEVFSPGSFYDKEEEQKVNEITECLSATVLFLSSKEAGSLSGSLFLSSIH